MNYWFTRAGHTAIKNRWRCLKFKHIRLSGNAEFVHTEFIVMYIVSYIINIILSIDGGNYTHLLNCNLGAQFM